MMKKGTSELKFKPRMLSLHNVVSLRMELANGDELLAIIDETVDHFRQVLVRNGYYTTGPMVFRALPESREFTIMTTLGNPVNLVEAHGTGFEFHRQLVLDTNYFYRHVDVEEPLPYADITEAVTAAGSRVDNIYHVMLDVYGDTMLDLYVDAVTR